MIIDSLQLIFIHVPRTGGTTIESLFGQPMCDTSPADAIIQKIGVNKYKSYFKFAVVRNPFDRLVSSYWFHELQQKYSVDDIIHNRTNAITNPSKTFSEYVNAIYNHFSMTNRLPDRATQWLQAGGAFASSPAIMSLYQPGDLVVDEILRYETFNSDIKNLLTKYGIEYGEIPCLNASTRANYQSYYNADLISKVSTAYADDLKFFNYKYEDIHF